MQRVWLAFSCFIFAPTAVALAAEPQYLHVNMGSDVLSQFWNQPVSIEANVLLPDSYYKELQKRYPVLYWVQGFGGVGEINLRDEINWQSPMRRLHREFILVLLDGMFNGGHQEFADSANNGPWGAALTTEFIPKTDAYFRTIAKPEDRFVGGHSSGGWSALWLQITYPDLFGAEWSVSPDPVDFRDFIGPDLTRVPPQNFYEDASGHDYEIDGVSLRAFVVGPGWERQQYESFDAVFSPRGSNDRPEELFNRRTGVIDPAVEQYWVKHYDISKILQDQWASLGPQLRGKIHIVVGSADQFHLDRPVRLLQQALQKLGSDAEIDYAPGANHFTVFNWHGGLIDYILTEASAKLEVTGS